MTGNGRAESRKRKLDSVPNVSINTEKVSKRQKNARNLHASRIENLRQIDANLQVNKTISQMDGALIADFIGRQTQRFEKDLSLVELEDRRIPEHAFLDSSNWEGDRTLDNLPSFVEFHTGKSREELATSPTHAQGAPEILAVTFAGQRAADLTRTLRVYQTESLPIAKLFAKHIKLKDAISFMKNSKINIGVGTPRRLLDLLQEGSLSLNRLTHIVVDGSHVDKKNRGIFDMQETLSPLTQLLSCRQIMQRYVDADPKIRVLVF